MNIYSALSKSNVKREYIRTLPAIHILKDSFRAVMEVRIVNE